MVYSYSIVFETVTQLEANELEHLQNQQDHKSTIESVINHPLDSWCKASIRHRNIFLNFSHPISSLSSSNQNSSTTQDHPKSQTKPSSISENHSKHFSLDWRFGKIEISGLDMDSLPVSSSPKVNQPSNSDSNNDNNNTTSKQDSSNDKLPQGSLESVPNTTSSSNITTRSSRSKSIVLQDRPDILKARFLGYGVIRLYREDTEIDQYPSSSSQLDNNKNQTKKKLQKSSNKAEEKTESTKPQEDNSKNTTLAILAVPSYLTPYDFIGFIGSNARDNISHFRMVRTAQPNRYMVLLKFRTAESAAKFHEEYNGHLFNSMEAETCQVVYINKIDFQNGNRSGLRRRPTISSVQIPYLLEDPFTLAATSDGLSDDENDNQTTKGENRNQGHIKYSGDNEESILDDNDGDEDEPEDGKHCNRFSKKRNSMKEKLNPGPPSKPAPPPTPILTELPTCPVCLERMDATTTGLLTIPCNHTFHCQCLSKWKDGSCPVCRYSQRESGKSPSRCAVCQARENLWICLICGDIGCGRYDNAHAFDHYEATGHCYAMDIESQRVWDYLSDAYVHRLLQNQADGKLVELPGPAPGSSGNERSRGSGESSQELSSWETGQGSGWIGGGSSEAAYDVANAAMKAADNTEKKFNDMSMHLTQLLSSQLESQRDYYESLMESAADKTSGASTRALAAETENKKLREEVSMFKDGTIPMLQKELEKTRRQADKFQKLSEKLEQSYTEEKLIGEQTIAKLKRLEGQEKELQSQIDELNETVRDLMFFHEAQEKLQNVGEDIQEGTIIVPVNNNNNNNNQTSRNNNNNNRGKGRRNRR